jgi:OOP family OmpA-OmpF porin
LFVIGHTCSIGTSGSNQLLSERRAKSVEKYLIENQIPAARISTKGYGETKPVAENGTEEGRIKNRRAEFIADRAKDKK